MNIKAVLLASQKTLIAVERHYPGIEPRQWPKGRPANLECDRDLLVADAVWTLHRIPAMIDAKDSDKAMHSLGTCQAVLWLMSVIEQSELESINRTAVAESAAA